jgi:hypothetical protein
MKQCIAALGEIGTVTFFKDVQKKLREQGVRYVYAIGFQVTANGGDPNSFFNQFLIGHGGHDIVTPDPQIAPRRSEGA